MRILKTIETTPGNKDAVIRRQAFWGWECWHGVTYAGNTPVTLSLFFDWTFWRLFK